MSGPGSSSQYPVTAAVRHLRALAAVFEPFLYDYQDKGGTARSSAMLGVPEHQVVKTLVMQADGGDFSRPGALVVLMHGDREVSTKALARLINAKTVKPMAPAEAEKHSGYQVGGTSPFGFKNAELTVHVQASILTLPWILINGGKRGFLVKLAPTVLERAFGTRLVKVEAAV